jgi:peptidyl-prolyl cis-trans isomerase B (cyclophilin B)
MENRHGNHTLKIHPKYWSIYMVKLHTNHGIITIDLYADKAPKTIANFLDYANSGAYNNTIFHRVIDGFMIQGGGFEPGMSQKPTNAPVENEAANGLKNEAYTVAMARTPDPHSATAQFFINIANNSFLNFTAATPQGFGYCVFGKVVEGQDVVDKIKKVKTGNCAGHQDIRRRHHRARRNRLIACTGTRTACSSPICICARAGCISTGCFLIFSKHARVMPRHCTYLVISSSHG